MSDDYSELEQELGERLPDLGNLYESTTDGDYEYLRPILDSLRNEKGHYTDETFVSAGGEKRIFKVRDLRTDRIVALAKPLEDASEEQKEQFLREGRLTACLQHPNILSVHDEGLDADGNPFFTMEYVHGDTLKEIIRKLQAGDESYIRRFPLPRLLELFVKICDAVAYAHSRGVLHLDIKPSNIFVGPYGEALLCDWGLGKVLRNEANVNAVDVPVEELPNGDILNDLTKTGFVKGTPGFMAPEQVVSHGKVSTRSDIYSLGALLYFMLVYRPPVSGESMLEVAELTLNGNIKPPSKAVYGRHVSSGLEAVVMKALALDPADRYQSVQAFRDELDRFLMGFATEAQDAGWVVQAGLLIKRRPFAFRVALISFFLLLLVGVGAFFRVLGEKREAEAARNEAQRNLVLYKQETEVSMALSDSIRATALDFINDEDFLNAPGKIKAITSHLQQETDPGNRQVMLEYLALLHFVVQDFRQAGECFSRIQVSKRYEACRDLALQYGANKSDHEWLNAEEMVALLNEVKRHIRYVAYYMAYYYFSEHPRMSAEELLPVVEVMLDTLNNLSYTEKSMSRLELTSRDQGLHLSLSGEPYSIFIMPIPVPIRQANVLRPLKLHSLDLSRSGLTDLERINGMLVDELNIAGLEDIPVYKFYIFERLKVRKVFHSLEHPDKYLRKHAPQVEFVRVENSM
ncbi:serine/threonine protein kinase [Pontiella sulfatireligans]|uniref:Serine/threonine-protein kinase PknD n=1 Tax=Pontiella sulfatireligans TaxID=2750658 RepID=A0A6C2USQ2_9BACT|nr:serine/threonine-protein kinase [Pontiella sulfatireligans]VGO23169.1 Serine/threonine-protein kinase PknD [Pontiella sulfatireligans]